MSEDDARGRGEARPQTRVHAHAHVLVQTCVHERREWNGRESGVKCVCLFVRLIVCFRRVERKSFLFEGGEEEEEIAEGLF